MGDDSSVWAAVVMFAAIALAFGFMFAILAGAL